MNKLLYMAFAMVLFFGCKTKKHINLETSKSKIELHGDSIYIDSIISNITLFKTTTIHFDTSGKPISIKINEAVRESKNELKKGNKTKAVTTENEEVKKIENIDRDGSELFSINYWGLIPVLLIVAMIIYLHQKK